MSYRLAEILEKCLDALEKGATLDECLEKYPSQAEQLKPLLLTSLMARIPGSPSIPGNAVTRGKARVLSQAKKLRMQPGSHPTLSGALRRVAISMAVVVFVILAGNGIISTSAKALPGDALYRVKRTVEFIRLELAFNPENESRIDEEITHRRIDETEELLFNQRVEEVEFEGLIEQQYPKGWIVTGILVEITDQTEIEGEPFVGSFVKVRGITQVNGSVQALRLRIEPAHDADDDSLLTPSLPPNEGEDNSDDPQSTLEPTVIGEDPSDKGGDDHDKNGTSNSGSENGTPVPKSDDD